MNSLSSVSNGCYILLPLAIIVFITLWNCAIKKTSKETPSIKIKKDEAKLNGQTSTNDRNKKAGKKSKSSSERMPTIEPDTALYPTFIDATTAALPARPSNHENTESTDLRTPDWMKGREELEAAPKHPIPS